MDCFYLVQAWADLDEEEQKEATHDDELTQCFIMLRFYTTDPPWITFIEDLVIKTPLSLQKDLQHYKELVDEGYDANFVYNALRYRSGRPVTDITAITKPMSKKFWNAGDLTRAVPYRDNTTTIADIPNGMYGTLLLPIVRYEAGMSRGLYYETAQGNYCGTYFYFEPGSGFYLESYKTLIASNKMSAAVYLGIPVVRTYITDAILWLKSKGLFQQPGYEDPLIPYLAEFGYKVKGMTGEEFMMMLVQDALLVDDTNYKTAMHSHYQLEDALDQPICLAGREQGIDCILFKYVTTKTRVISEILDNRPRDICYANILYPPLLE
jgi:hypothetical protein